MFFSILLAAIHTLNIWNSIGPLSMGENVSDVFRTLGPAPLVRDCNGGCHYKAAYTDGKDLLAVSFVQSFSQDIRTQPKNFDHLLLETIGLYRGHHTCLGITDQDYASANPDYFPWIIAPGVHTTRMKYRQNLSSWTWLNKTGFQGITSNGISIPQFSITYRAYGQFGYDPCGVVAYHGTPHDGLAARIVVYVQPHDVGIDSVEESINAVDPLDSKTIEDEGEYLP